MVKHAGWSGSDTTTAAPSRATELRRRQPLSRLRVKLDSLRVRDDPVQPDVRRDRHRAQEPALLLAQLFELDGLLL